jgi:acyl carrier protein
MSDSITDPSAAARELLKGYPAATVEAAVEFSRSRSPQALDRLVLGVVAFHLPRRNDRDLDLSKLGGSTRLVEDLAIDSLAIVEINFLLTDLLGVHLEEEELRRLVTLDDLRRLLARHLRIGPET